MPLRRLLLAFATVLYSSVAFANAVFYQPQVRDRAVPAKQWPAVFAQTRAMGFDTLVVQWTRHGDAFATQDERDWLTARMLDARQSGMKLIIGLYADPDIHSRLQQPDSALDNYLLKLNQKNRALATHWVNTLGLEKIDGWYLPLEIDDRRWRDVQSQKRLKTYLDREAQQLHALLPRPLYISTFFVGNMAPENYAGMLERLTSHNHIRVWVQDGTGMGKRNASERKLYMDALYPCDKPVAKGSIFELFRQTSQTSNEESFKAKPLPPAQMKVALKQRTPCNGERAFFSLRYLPLQRSTLPR